MTVTPAVPTAGAARWTCPFCPLACDHLSVKVDGSGRGLELAGGDCARARVALAGFAAEPSDVAPRVDGREASLDAALGAAVRILEASRLPLLGGLGTDVAGARSLYRLACATGAISDAANGAALTQGLRALQDRGGYTTTLSEVRARADLIVMFGGLPLDEAPNLLDRFGLGDGRPRRVVVLAPAPRDAAALEALAAFADVSVDRVPLQGDLHAAAALLAACVDGRGVEAAPALAALAEALRAAHYAVIVCAVGRLPAQGALIVEALNRVVERLNMTTRAGALWIGAAGGAATANQVYTWLSGLPLRSRAGPAGLEHEPVCFDTQRLLTDGAVDALVWVACFDAAAKPPPTSLPLIVLGHPALAATCDRPGSVFIPVSTPGIGSAGHLFRTDGVVLLPLFPVYADTLPTVPRVVDRLVQGLEK
jgi:formylmethanofuran dehydrogenase subunit B